MHTKLVVNSYRAVIALLVIVSVSCNDSNPYASAYRIEHRSQIVGGEAALADVGDLILENDKIRLGIPQIGNSVGPGIYGGSLLDADLQRNAAAYRQGHGLDQFGEMFPIGNLSIPALCEREGGEESGFCRFGDDAQPPTLTILCDGQTPCTTCSGPACSIDLTRLDNRDYASVADASVAGSSAPSQKAAVIRVQAMTGNYLEAIGLVGLAKVKLNFRIRHDYILEPGTNVVRLRTLLTEAGRAGQPLHPQGAVVELPPLTRPKALFAVLLGSKYFSTEIPNLEPGIAGGDFLFFGDRLKFFAPGLGFDVYRDIRKKFAVGDDPINNPIAAEFLAGVGQHVSYAIASASEHGLLLLPLLSGAVTAGVTHAAHCSSQCTGTPEQCSNVIDCASVRSVAFERLFAVGDGDVASAAASLYRARKVALGELRGRVIDQRDGQPISSADVFVYPVPNTLAECTGSNDVDQAYSGGTQAFVEQCLKPRHFAGVINHLRTDRRALDLPEGRFDGFLPVGQYYLLAKVKSRPLSRVEFVEIAQDQISQVNLTIASPARLQIEIRDENDQRIPAKLTIGQCMPNCAWRYEGTCQTDDDCSVGVCVVTLDQKRCQIDNCPENSYCDHETRNCVSTEECTLGEQCQDTQQCLSGRCVCVPRFEKLAALGEGSYPRGLGHYYYTADGTAQIELEADAYEVIASRGIEYSIDRQSVEVLPNHTQKMVFRLKHEVDTTGWISGDFHVHGSNSYDATVSHRDRVVSFAGEGVEILSTSDHDYVTDLSPYVFSLGLEKWLKTQVGVELTTVEIGHWLGFPLRYEQWRDGVRVEEQGAINWTGHTPEQHHRELRNLGRYSPEETVVVVAHPRDSFFGYFDQYGLNAYDPSLVEGTLFEYFPPIHTNPLANPDNFSGTFDALEVFNSKRFEMIRTPSVGEIRDYNQARKIVQADPSLSAEELEQKLIALDRIYIKQILERTPEEQAAVWSADGKAPCDLYEFCTADQDCKSGQQCDLLSFVCYRACQQDSDCDTACVDQRCIPDLTEALMPCSDEQGVVDDWFRLLDYGVVRTGMGNSDTHNLFSGTEAGVPRNFIHVSTQQPIATDLREVNRAIKQGAVVASYGPFVEAWLDNKPISNQPVQPSTNTISLRVRVQSPGWFDVDRVEIYRSGQLIHVLDGSGDQLDPNSSVNVTGLLVPNKTTLNLDHTFSEAVGDSDAWFVVIAMGLSGRDLSPIYTEHPYLKLQVGDVLNRSFASVPLPLDLSSSSVPRVFRVYPYAVTNPLFLDADKNGRYDAPHQTPAWADGPVASGLTAYSSAQPKTHSKKVERSATRDPARELRHLFHLWQRAFQKK